MTGGRLHAGGPLATGSDLLIADYQLRRPRPACVSSANLCNHDLRELLQAQGNVCRALEYIPP
jgi:hypothetical protein